MKTRSFDRRLSFFVSQRIHGNVLAWVSPDSETEKSKSGVTNILRWEDDGGRMPDIGDPSVQVKPGYGPGKRMMNVSRKGS